MRRKISKIPASPNFTLSDETEWVELANHGFNRVAGTDSERVYSAFQDMINLKIDSQVKLYGHGDSGKKIVSILADHL